MILSGTCNKLFERLCGPRPIAVNESLHKWRGYNKTCGLKAASCERKGAVQACRGDSDSESRVCGLPVLLADSSVQTREGTCECLSVKTNELHLKPT